MVCSNHSAIDSSDRAVAHHMFKCSKLGKKEKNFNINIILLIELQYIVSLPLYYNTCITKFLSIHTRSHFHVGRGAE